MRYFLLSLVLLAGCASTEIIESPKTTYVSEIGKPKRPQLIWTSRVLERSYDFLGTIKARSLTHDGAVDRLIEGGRKLRADAVVDVNFQRVGFFIDMQAFAIKFKKESK